MKKEGLPLTELNKILKKWVKIFGLVGWKIELKVVSFTRKDFRQSGDIKIDLKNKKASLLVTNKSFRNEESTIIHELIHLLLWKYDSFSEKIILRNFAKSSATHKKYLNELEKTVAKLTDIFLGFKT